MEAGPDGRPGFVAEPQRSGARRHNRASQQNVLLPARRGAAAIAPRPLIGDGASSAHLGMSHPNGLPRSITIVVVTQLDAKITWLSCCSGVCVCV